MRFKFCLILLAVIGIGDAAVASDTKLQALLDARQKLCFARVYDRAHFAAHPKQKIDRMFVALSRDKASAYWTTASAANSEINPKGNDDPENAEGSAQRQVNIAGFASFRGGQRPEIFSGWCNSFSDPKLKRELLCGMECDRQIGSVSLDDAGRLAVDNVERVLFLDPGDEDSPAQMLASKRALGEDDRNFRLEPRPIEDCIAEANKTNPGWAQQGPPLRERLKADAPFCFGRDYSAAHLASHPDQETLSIRVARDVQIISADRAKGKLGGWPDGATVSVSVTTRKTGRPTTLRYVCSPEEFQWTCTARPCMEQDGGCSKKEGEADCEIFLRRGPKDSMMLGNPRAGLPLEGVCGRGTKTISDDKSYRLEPLPLSACAR